MNRSLGIRVCATWALVLCLGGSLQAREPVASALVPEIILQVNDTTVSPHDTLYYLSVFLTNVLQSVAGVEMTISAGQSGLFRLPDSLKIDTTILCIDPSDCIPADTIVDTAHVTPVALAGSPLSAWDFVQARALSPYSFRLAAVADFPGGISPQPIPPGGPRLLCRMLLEREVALPVLDTLTERSVAWNVALGVTSFSDPTGKSIGLQDSTVCLDPPACAELDTVYYYDPMINIYVDGSITFGPACLRGDVNGSETVNGTDIIFLVSYVFKGGPQPGCSGLSGDVDCSGSVSSADVIYLVNYVFKGGPAPCAW